MGSRLVRCGAVLRLVAAAMLAFGFAFTGWATGTAHAEGDTAGADRFGACLASQKAGDLLILVDESGSLKSTDAQAARVQAAKYLVDTLGRYADRSHSKLDVAIAGFSDSYAVQADWAPLSEGTADSVKNNLDTLARRNDGLDTDYWLALDGARQTLASHAQGDPNRCQAISWFSDGKIDYSPRAGSKPYAPDVDLGTQAGVDEMINRATEGICRDGGVADQLRSDGIVMLGVGLGDQAASNADFDVMSAIATGTGLNGKSCGSIKTPKPGDFYPVSNIDQMLFAFDALNPDPHIDDTKPVCQQGQVCQEARHNFVLDRSVKAVNILGSGGVPGIVPYLIAPSGQQLQLPKEEGKKQATLDGMPVQFEWQSDSAQTVSIQSADSPAWPGQWAIVYVDTTGQHGDAVSRVNIHISTDIFPALQADPDSPWRAGQVMKGVKFGLVDGAGTPIDPATLAGDAMMSASLAVDGGAPVEVLTSVPKTAIGNPIDVDLTKVKPGAATLRMSLVITTAPAVDPQGAQIAPGTKLSPQQVDSPMQILPKVGLPVPGQHIDFGDVQGTKGTTAQLEVTGPGCVWIADGEASKVVAGPEGIGTVSVTSSSSGPGNCLKVDKDQKASLPVTLHTERDGHGGLNGSVPVHIAPQDKPDDAQTVDVTFSASMTKPLSTTNFVLVFIAALLLGPGIPLALLYAAKWYTGKIPGVPMLAERIPVEVDSGAVRRNGEPFAMADTDLVTPVPGLAGGARQLTVHGVQFSTVNGRSPFGTAHVKVTAPGYLSAGSDIPATDASGVHAVLPLAVHGKWVLLHNPGGAENRAEVLLMVRGQSDVPERQKLYEDIERRLPDLLSGLRQRAASANLVTGGGPPPSPFGAAAAGPPGADPFAAAGAAGPTDPFAGAGRGPAPPSVDPYAQTGLTGAPRSPAPSAGVDPYGQTGIAPTPPQPTPRGSIDPYANTQQAQTMPGPDYPPRPDDQRPGRDQPFDPFGGGA
ncbi:VWA domain-containing protein [Mycobacterium sp. pUA109]|uniref:vWA domain-containing protein n=1 Tax=Mycobacterium sp. pUA109 TaxID=3238982 RepID=UPI00351BB240